MKKKAFSVAAVAGVLLFSGCGKQSDNTSSNADASKTPSSSLVETKPTPDNSVAIVNGKPVSKALFQSVMAELAQRSPGQSIPEDKVLDGLIARELLRQEAEKLNLANDPQVAAKLDKARQDVLVQAEVEHFRKTATVPEEDVKKEYDTRVAAMAGGTEYKARHILLETEQAAKDVLGKLKKGAKFEDLAKKLSKDPSAKQNGGDLGWFNPQQMVPEFSAAVAGLKNGETTEAPVKSQFGWHVIQREESREPAVPPFDAVKDQFRSVLLAQKLQKHVEEMKAAAKIERLLPPAKPAEPPKAEAPSAEPAKDGEAAAPSAEPAKEEKKDSTKLLEAGKPVKPAKLPAPSAPAKPAN